MAITNKDKIKVEGHRGTWYVVEETMIFGKMFYLLEHNTYGEDAHWIAVDTEGKLIMEDITDGEDDLMNYLEENPHLLK